MDENEVFPSTALDLQRETALREAVTFVAASIPIGGLVTAEQTVEVAGIFLGFLRGAPAQAAEDAHTARTRDEPAVPIEESVYPDRIVCLDDGQSFAMLKRHIAALGYTPESYRAYWGLADDYPMVAPNYTAKRSAIAKEMGLGVRGRTSRSRAAAE
jgi:MucR family transcriptional regulator, transcriptional regulator of exopolysaccharide biosynthesis